MKASTPRVGIVTDSTADIPDNILKALKVEVVPALLVMDGETFIDGVDISRSQFYQRMPSLNEPPTTASPSPIQFRNAYQRLIEQGLEKIISIHVSSKLSGMLNAAHQAAMEFGDRVNIFDSQQVSLGLGYQVTEAAKLALQGLGLDAITEHLGTVRNSIRLLALIDTLEYLRRGGRVSWLQAGVSDLLKIKLLLTLKDGFVEAYGRSRTFSRALNLLRDQVRSWAPLSQLAVMHSGIADLAGSLADELQNHSSTKPLIVEVTTVIGAHVGPGAIGVAGLPQI